MKYLALAIASLIVGAALVVGQTTPSAGTKGMGKGMMQQKKAAGGAGCAMMSSHEEMRKLADQVAAGLAALQRETDLATLKANLATNQALFDQLRGKISDCGAKMAGTAEPPTRPNSGDPAAGHENHH